MNVTGSQIFDFDVHDVLQLVAEHFPITAQGGGFQHSASAVNKLQHGFSHSVRISFFFLNALEPLCRLEIHFVLCAAGKHSAVSLAVRTNTLGHLGEICAVFCLLNDQFCLFHFHKLLFKMCRLVET